MKASLILKVQKVDFSKAINFAIFQAFKVFRTLNNFLTNLLLALLLLSPTL